MEIRYRREMKRNYLIAEPESGGRPGYEARMLVNNSIEGLLRFHIKYMDEHQLYYYEITSMQPLGRLLESRFITREEICQLLVQLHVTLMRMEEYFLSEDGLLLEPEYIYVKPEWFGIGLCLVPGGAGDFPMQLSRLLQYLMKKVDHRDKECVMLAYGLYQESQKENYDIEDLMKLVQKESRAKGHTADHGEMQREPEPEELFTAAEPDRRWGGERDQPGGREPARPGLPRAGAGKVGAGVGKPGAGKVRAGNAGELDAGRERPGTADIGVGAAAPGTPAPGKLARLAAGQAALWCMVFVGGPTLIWLLKGPALLRTYWKLGIGAAAAALAVIAAGDAIFYRMKQTGSTRRQEPGHTAPSFSPWDGEDPWSLENPERNEKPKSQWEIPCQEPEPPEETVQPCFQTTLLTTAVSGGRRLSAESPEAEDIEISYFPYIIGKQEDLVDYVLMRQTVSRLHLRIDKEGEEYRVTDLNSTNGTQVGGRLLDANETAAIRPGETLCIADLVYIFK